MLTLSNYPDLIMAMPLSDREKAKMLVEFHNSLRFKFFGIPISPHIDLPLVEKLFDEKKDRV